jgi:hypothetical protein
VKRLLAVAWLLAAVAWGLPASAIWMFGGGAAYTSQATADGRPWDAAAVGFLAQAYLGLGEATGLYAATTLGVVVGSQAHGLSLDIGQYQSMSADVLLGIGTRLTIAPGLDATGGAGLYMGTQTLAATNQTLSSYYAGGFGAGVGLSLLYALSLNWGIGLSLNAAYSFANPGDTLPTMAPGGLHVFGGIGVVYYGYAVTETPRYSRY